MTRIDHETCGVYAIAPTPFTDTGEIDLASTDRLIEFYVEAGVGGLTVLGVLGEAPKLAAAEAGAFLGHVLRRVAGRVPVVAGASNPGTDSLVAFAKGAMDLGAAGVMVAPIPGLKTDDDVYAYAEAVLTRLAGVPVCYQDYPQTTTVSTSVAVLHRMIDALPNLVMLKHEEAPGLNKITRLRERAMRGEGRRLSILVGNGGLHLPQELRRGADGAMTGFAYPEMLVSVCERFAAGDPDGGEDIYDLYLPILRHEQQMGIGLAIRKEILRRRGAIACAAVRHPGPRLLPQDHAELDGLMHRLERKLHK